MDFRSSYLDHLSAPNSSCLARLKSQSLHPQLGKTLLSGLAGTPQHLRREDSVDRAQAEPLGVQNVPRTGSRWLWAGALASSLGALVPLVSSQGHFTALLNPVLQVLAGGEGWMTPSWPEKEALLTECKLQLWCVPERRESRLLTRCRRVGGPSGAP